MERLRCRGPDPHERRDPGPVLRPLPLGDPNLHQRFLYEQPQVFHSSPIFLNFFYLFGVAVEVSVDLISYDFSVARMDD